MFPNLNQFVSIGRSRIFEKRERPLRLLFVGRLAPEKNLSLLLRSVATLVDGRELVQMRIVGSGPEEKKIRALATELSLDEIVEFIPWTDTVCDEFSWADVFCLSSNHEGWAMVLEEAAAAKLAIVTTDVGCAGELIRPNQEGLVVPVGDYVAYSAALQKLTDYELRVRLARHAYDRVAKRDNTYIDRWIATHPVE